jgi:hypothetical protein
MLVIGFDPGVHVGWAVVEVQRPPVRPHLVRTGVISGSASFSDYVLLMNAIDLVAIEQTSGIAFAGKKGIVANLLDCAAVHGGIARIAESLGKPIELVRAVDWRGSLLRKPNASDSDIAEWAKRNVLDMPPRTNVHTRDAIGVAVAGGLRRVSAPQSLPAAATQSRPFAG